MSSRLDPEPQRRVDALLMDVVSFRMCIQDTGLRPTRMWWEDLMRGRSVANVSVPYVWGAAEGGPAESCFCLREGNTGVQRGELSDCSSSWKANWAPYKSVEGWGQETWIRLASGPNQVTLPPWLLAYSSVKGVICLDHNCLKCVLQNTSILGGTL